MYFGGGWKGGNTVYGGPFNSRRNDQMRKLGTSYLRKGSELLTEAAYERVRGEESERGRGGRGGVKRRGASDKSFLGGQGRGKKRRGNFESAHNSPYKTYGNFAFGSSFSFSPSNHPFHPRGNYLPSSASSIYGGGGDRRFNLQGGVSEKPKNRRRGYSSSDEEGEESSNEESDYSNESESGLEKKEKEDEDKTKKTGDLLSYWQKLGVNELDRQKERKRKIGGKKKQPKVKTEPKKKQRQPKTKPKTKKIPLKKKNLGNKKKKENNSEKKNTKKKIETKAKQKKKEKQTKPKTKIDKSKPSKNKKSVKISKFPTIFD